MTVSVTHAPLRVCRPHDAFNAPWPASPAPSMSAAAIHNERLPLHQDGSVSRGSVTATCRLGQRASVAQRSSVAGRGGQSAGAIAITVPCPRCPAQVPLLISTSPPRLPRSRRRVGGLYAHLDPPPKPLLPRQRPRTLLTTPQPLPALVSHHVCVCCEALDDYFKRPQGAYFVHILSTVSCSPPCRVAF